MKNSDGLDLNSYAKGSSVFVRNLTKTDVNLHINDVQGRVFIVTIPRTFIPLDLTEWANVEQLKESQELRAALRGGVLKLVTDKDANDILSTPEGSMEYERVMNRLNLVTKDLLADNTDVTKSSSMDSVAIGNMDEVNDQIRNAISDKDMSDNDRYVLIIGLDKEEPLSRVDLEFIQSSVDNSQTELLKFVRNRLKEMSGLLSK